MKGNSPLSLLTIQIDDFKSYDDAYGHAAGDDALKAVARLLQECLRAGDLLTRRGGPDFVALLPNTGPEGAKVIALRIHRAIRQAAWPRRPITVSVGVASDTAPAEHQTQLLGNADAALQDARTGGKNQVVQFKAA